MSLSIHNVRSVLSSVSFDNETSSKKLAAVDTFEMVRGGNYLKSHKSAAASGKDGKCSSSSCAAEPAQAQTQNQAQSSAKEADAKVADAKDEAQVQGQSQAQGAKEAQAQADAKAKGYSNT